MVRVVVVSGEVEVVVVAADNREKQSRRVNKRKLLEI